MNLDEAQLIIKNQLDNLAQSLEKQQSEVNSINFLLNFFKKSKTQNEFFGFYIYGDVGRGKTMLMKYFYEKIQRTPKIYFHFNGFMILLHKTLHKIRQKPKRSGDDLVEALQEIIINQKLICFDEFQVVDIADAMLLSILFTFIYDQQIIVVFTSNSHPLELYKNGLQRELFIDFVNNVLLTNSQLIHLDSTIDYRELKTKNSFKKFLVNNQNNREIFANYITSYTKNKIIGIKKLKVWGRDLIVKKSYEDIAIFDANELFYENLHSSDYHQICMNFNLIFIKNLRKFSDDEPNEIKRLTLFIDEVYESKIALIILSKTTIDKLLDQELIQTKYQFFARTI